MVNMGNVSMVTNTKTERGRIVACDGFPALQAVRAHALTLKLNRVRGASAAHQRRISGAKTLVRLYVGGGTNCILYEQGHANRILQDIPSEQPRFLERPIKGPKVQPVHPSRVVRKALGRSLRKKPTTRVPLTDPPSSSELDKKLLLQGAAEPSEYHVRLDIEQRSNAFI